MYGTPEALKALWDGPILPGWAVHDRDLAQANADPAAVLSDKQDAGFFQRAPQRCPGAAGRVTRAPLEIDNGALSHPGGDTKLLP